MLKRPSTRRKSKQEQINLNLVPILDTMVTLIGFMLFTTSFLAFVDIETPIPESSRAIVEQKLKEKPLQLTLSLRSKDAEIWSPFERVPSKKFEHLPDGQPDLRAIHEALIAIKSQFPLENRLILVPHPTMTYDTLVAVMDATRGLEATDPPLFTKNVTTGNDEPMKALFGDVVFGNLLGGGD